MFVYWGFRARRQLRSFCAHLDEDGGGWGSREGELDEDGGGWGSREGELDEDGGGLDEDGDIR